MQQENNLIQYQSAEENFRAAFDRLKAGHPQIIARESPISQNNVAKEAGCDPSALRKSRYPELIREIQLWVTEKTERRPPSPRQKVLKSREHNRSLKQKILELKAQRDHAISLLLSANAKILDLSEELDMLRGISTQSNVSPMKTAHKRKL